MLTKRANGFVGYGFTEEEALDSCRIISMLKSAYNIQGFTGMVERHAELAPWCPRETSIHIKGIGYITISNNELHVNGKNVPISSSIFELLYKSFSDKLSMVDIAICSTEIQKFLSKNKIDYSAFDTYEQVIPEDVYFEDESILCNIITGDYSIVLWNNGQVGLKLNSEEMYWVCSYDVEKGSLTDILYYIAYVRGYTNIDDVLEVL